MDIFYARQKKQSVPYFIENISTNIYSVEELCYYLYHNLYLIDKTIINEELCIWIGEELNLPGLAAKIRQFLGQDIHVDDVIYPVFKEINYLTYEELKALNSRLVLISKESADMRQKQKGDSLMENGMYVNAIRVYQKLLRGQIWRSRGRDLCPMYGITWDAPTAIFFRWRKPWSVFITHGKRRNLRKN